ncbi:MAG: DUF4363 family protein [Bacillota bacterium]
MKVWLLSLLGLILFIMLAVFVQNKVQTNTRKLDQEIKRVNSTLNRKQWSQTLEQLKGVKKKWERVKPMWAVIIHHQEIDSIDQALTRTLEATKSKNYTQAQIELGSLQHFIRHVPEREKFNLVNIF